jgi:hypothetical protein
MGRFTLVSFQNRALVNKTEHINVQGNTLSTSVVNTLPVVSFDSWNCRFTWYTLDCFKFKIYFDSETNGLFLKTRKMPFVFPCD